MKEIDKKEQQLHNVLSIWEKKRAKFAQVESDYKIAMELDAEFLKEKQQLIQTMNNKTPRSKTVARLPSLESLADDDDVPDGFLCPITLSLMENPVILVDSGQTYEKESITQWLQSNKVDPITKIPISNMQLVPNYSLKRAITEWKEKNKKK